MRIQSLINRLLQISPLVFGGHSLGKTTVFSWKWSKLSSDIPEDRPDQRLRKLSVCWYWRSEDNRNVILLIDGLDEFSEENGVRAEFIKALQSILTEVPKDGISLQLMVTSRMAQSIFNGATELEIRAADSDITGLINSRIDSGMCLSKTFSAKIREDQGLGRHVVTRIIEKADGS